VIGAGSNMLISDKGFDGIVIKLKRDFNTISVEGEKVVAYSAAMLPMLIKTTVDYSLAGLEELFGIPGSVGGGIIMNAGTKTSTISDYLEYIEVIKINTPEEGIIKLAKEQINFKYRSSGLEDQYVIIKACFKLKKGDSELLKKRINECLLKRSETQPLGTFNAGCVFKNPYEGEKDITAAKLIESAGLKGFSIGGACVSEKHANFIINKNNATCEDFVNLIKYVIKVVKEKYSVELQPEITLVGVEL
jgi:UDP-N-acetylmuramate dehydrogenase